jgi:hypothetical protein
MKNKTTGWIAAIIILICPALPLAHCHAQTNPPTPAVELGFPVNPSPAWMDKTATDVSVVLGDFGVPATPQEIKGKINLWHTQYWFR